MNIQPEHIRIKDFRYALPPELIAFHPLVQRDQSRLLHYRAGHISDHRFYELPHLLPTKALLVLNDTRVIEARILFQKPTGGQIEIFCLSPWQIPIEQALMRKGRVQWLCLIGGASKWKPGQVLQKRIRINDLEVLLEARYIQKAEESFVIELSWNQEQFSFSELLHAAGAIPLPPYIKREVSKEDSERYQTVFGKWEGSVAAPTAALHFTKESFEALAAKGICWDHITLHVGAGTFKPVKSDTIAGHEMHSEPFSVSRSLVDKLLNAPLIVAVGTTSLRTLETIYWIGVKLFHHGELQEPVLHQWEAYQLADLPPVSKELSLSTLLKWMDAHQMERLQFHTSLIIVPGYRFHLPGALITNFHQPESTLLLLIAAFIGADWKKVYAHAMDQQYRFLSYGDSSLLWRG